MATLSPNGLQYVNSLATPNNNATNAVWYEWNPLFSGWAGDIVGIDHFRNELVPQPSPVSQGPDPDFVYEPVWGVISGFKYTLASPAMITDQTSEFFLNSYSLQPDSKVYVCVITDPFAIFEIQTNAPLGVPVSHMWNYFAVVGTNGTYTVTRGATPITYPIGTAQNKSSLVLDSSSIQNIYYSSIPAAPMAVTGNLIVQVVGLAKGSVWYDAANPSASSAYNSVQVQLVGRQPILPSRV